MPRPKGQEQGLRNPLILRSGITLPEFHGINKERDPGAIADNQFTDLVNVRLVGGRVDCRGGQAKLNSIPMDGCILGLWDSETEWPDEDSSGRALLMHTLDSAPTTDGIKTYSVTTGLVAAGDASSGFFPEPEAAPAQGFLRDGSATVMGNNFGGLYCSSVRFGTSSDIYMGSITGGNVAVLDSNGSVVVQTTGLGSAAAKVLVAYYNGDIYAFTGNYAYRRSSSGVWTSLVMPTTAYLPSGWAAYRGKRYVSGYDTVAAERYPTILSCDGVTVATAFQVSITTGMGYLYTSGSMAALNGSLFFTWSHRLATDAQFKWWVGKYDGSTWTGEWGLMTITMPAADLAALRLLIPDPAAIRSWAGSQSLVAFRGYLYSHGSCRAEIGNPGTGPNCFHYLIRSSTGATWSPIVRLHPITEAHGEYNPADMVAI